MPVIAFSQHPHDRIADRRTDEAWLARAWADPATRVLVISGGRFRLVGGDLTWLAPGDAPEGERVLLGERDGAARFAVLTDSARAKAAPEEWSGLRGALGFADTLDTELLVHAIGISEWRHAMRFCPHCGGALGSDHAGHQLTCTACGRSQFPRTDPAVIMLITHGSGDDERCLLGRASSWPPGRYSTLAGFVEPGESLENAVRREVLEETGVRVGEVEYVGSQPWPLPASLMVGFTGVAESTEIRVDGEEIEDARWFTRRQMLDQATAGDLLLPSGISISRLLIEGWYGDALPGIWS